MQLAADADIGEHSVTGLVEHMRAIFDRLQNLQEIIGNTLSPGGTIGGRLDELWRKYSDLQSRLWTKSGAGNTDAGAAAAAADSIPGAASSSGFGSASFAELGAEKLPILEGVITVLNREMEKMTGELEGVERQRHMERDHLDSMDRKLRSLEKLIAVKDATINELSIKLESMELTSYDGTLIWRVSEVKRKRQEAVSGRITSVYSPPFFTSRTGI